MKQMRVNTIHTESSPQSTYALMRKKKPVRLAMNLLCALILIALFAPILANEKPLYFSYQSQNYFPAFWDLNPFLDKNYYELKSPNGQTEILQLDIAEWKNLNYDYAIWCPIPYSPGKSDYANSNFASPFGTQNRNATTKMPLRFRHILGTGVRGEDVLAGLIHGTRISLAVGIISMLIASIIGLFLGAMSGYFGDDDFLISRAVLGSSIAGIGLGFFYAFYVQKYEISDAFANSSFAGFVQFFVSLIYFVLLIFAFIVVGKYIQKKGLGQKRMALPLDNIISRIIDISTSLPTFILILSIAAITKASLINLIFIIAFTSWTSIARLTRAEILRIKKLDYIQAAKALGYGQNRIIIRHALLNGIAPALVAIAFGIASTILVESSLSFLGIGLPIETVTWGSMLSEGRSQFSAWWMTLFPGLAIFITVTLYNLLGDGLREIR